MKLYNTLSRKIEDLVPQAPPEVTIYTCGPTVYDYPHVGNWFTYIREDVLVRTLKTLKLQPKWVMNITDVGHLVSDADEGEDKLEKGARREGKTAWEVAEFYTDYFVKGMQRLNMLTPDELPKATDHIAEQIALIQKLEAKGFTYTITDGVYFDTSKFPKYADFARLDLDEQQEGARVELNPEKRNPTDFALWKFSPTDRQRDMEWDSPWGKGFPGWHIECSAMSMKYLGETLDVHAGGIDHVPVHHTNEIAQSEAATGKPFAKFWLHSNHITIEGEKIAKSAGNSVTLEDIDAKGLSLEAFRLHVLESHYHSQSKFSWESLQASQNRLSHWHEVAALQWQGDTLKNTPPHYTADDIKVGQQQLLLALQNDLDTPNALATVDAVFSRLESHYSLDDIAAFKNFLQLINDTLGINLLRRQDIPIEAKQLIQDRERARSAKDWLRSDQLRDQLVQQKIGLRDIPTGTIWYWL